MRVVLVRLSALGDIVHTWPLAAALRRAEPGMHLTWVVEEPLLPLVADHPAVDAAIAVATRRWRRRPVAARTRFEVAAVRTRLRELEADLCLDPQGVLKSALVTRWTRARRRVGLARPWRREVLAGVAYTEVVAGALQQPHVVATNLAMLRSVGVEPPAEPVAPDGRWLLGSPTVEAALGSQGGAVLLPGAGQPGKVLAADTLASIARALLGDGLHVSVLWGPGERDRAQEVAAAAPGVDVAPPTSIPEMAGWLGRAAVVVGGDTGPVHLAASLGTPTVAVFLTTAGERNAPLGPSARVVSATRPIPRRPTGSARAEPARPVQAGEVVAVVRDLLAGVTEREETSADATISPVNGDRNGR